MEIPRLGSSSPGAPQNAPVMMDLGQAVLHHATLVSGRGPVTIVADRQQWSYAAGFRFQKSALPGVERLAIRVDIAVEAGRIGLVFVKDDLREVLGNDEERAPSDGRASAEILVDDVPDSGWIVVRNNAPGGVESRCLIHGIQVHSLPPSPLRGFSEWAPADETGTRVFGALRQKWNEVPVSLSLRRKTAELLDLDSSRLLQLWEQGRREATIGPGYSARGWYQDLYRDALRGKKVLDVGAGFGIDGMTFAQAGARITFLDIAETNLAVLRRIARALGIQADFFLLEDLNSLSALPPDFDVIWCQGSMLHVPFEFSRREAQNLLAHLPAGGRWIELTYPRERWEREGSLPFDQWGRLTDGAATPWAQWYDLPRVLERLQPAEFDVVLSFNFHNNDFNWFDLVRRK